MGGWTKRVLLFLLLIAIIATGAWLIYWVIIRHWIGSFSSIDAVSLKLTGGLLATIFATYLCAAVYRVYWGSYRVAIFAAVGLFLLVPLFIVAMKSEGLKSLLVAKLPESGSLPHMPDKMASNEDESKQQSTVQSDGIRTKAEPTANWLNTGLENDPGTQSVYIAVLDGSGLLEERTSEIAKGAEALGFQTRMNLFKQGFFRSGEYERMRSGESEYIKRLNLQKYVDLVLLLHATGSVRKASGYSEIQQEFFVYTLKAQGLVIDPVINEVKRVSFRNNANGVSAAMAEDAAWDKLNNSIADEKVLKK